MQSIRPIFTSRIPRAFALSGIISALALAFSGCGKNKNAAATAAPAPTEVGVVTLETKPVTLTRELPGRTSALRVAEVRARVSGIVLQRLFTEGSEVKAGQPLYQIDPAPYQAALDSAKAQLARAEANAASAKLQSDRYRELVAARAVSQQEADNASAQQLASAADVAAGQAAVQTAQINLDYTRVLAPISGRAGRSEVTEGAYVQAGTATLLTTIQQLDQLYVDVTQSSSELLALQQDLASGKLTRASDGAVRVTLTLDNGRAYAEAGTLQFADVSVDATTGSVLLRAIVPNPQRQLLPGMFVRARLEEGVNPTALLVPQTGVARNQRGEATALIVGRDRKVELRTLHTDRAIGSDWLVTAGVSAGDQLIVQNLQKIRPGMEVKAVPATNLESATTDAPAATASARQ